jgi:hypothetical protein
LNKTGIDHFLSFFFVFMTIMITTRRLKIVGLQNKENLFFSNHYH